MKDLPLRNIFLPAALAGASIFSSLAFALPTVVNYYAGNGAQGANSWRSPNTLTGLHKEIVITYVGAAIVLSAGVGLGTAEVLRRRTNPASKPLTFKTALAEFVDQQAVEESPDIEAAFSSLVAAYAPQATATETTPAEPVEALDRLLWPSTATDSEAGSVPTTAEAADNTVIFPAQYQRCRIQVPEAARQQYAIAFKDQFYSLLSSGMSKEQALATVNHLEQEQRAAILTRMNQGYAVWVIEPTAELVSAA